MAATVTVDPRDRPPELTVRSDGRIEGVRYVLVEGLDTNKSSAERVVQAISESYPHLNKEQWPGAMGAQGLRVDSRHVTQSEDARDKAYIVVRYATPEIHAVPPQDQTDAPPRISIGSSLISEQTAFDVDGKQIYTNQAKAQTPSGDGKRIPANVTLERPLERLNFQRRELEDPREKLRICRRRVNGTPMLDDPPRVWMCTDASADLSDDGISWIVNYEFVCNYAVLKAAHVDGLSKDVVVGWDVVVVEDNPETGRPVEAPKWSTDANENGGIVVARMHPQADFSVLRLW